MKKLLLVCGICLGAFIVKAQESNESTDFNKYCVKMESNMLAASKEKDYPKAIAVVNDWLGRYNKLSPAAKQNSQGLTQSLYYNQACYTALNKQKPEAIAWFKKAVDEGFSNYANASVDSDLNSLRDDPTFIKLLSQIRGKYDYGYILKNAGTYSNAATGLPAFTYQSPSAPELVDFKIKFNLDSVSGNGDEISKIKNLLYWAHNVVRHDGNSNNPPSRNALDIIAVCKKDDRGVNCRMMATILKDAYQAEGFKARLVTCMPKDTADFDCHVITVVWSKTLNKWVWMDPTFNAYVSDDQGNLLNIEEVRGRLIASKPLVLNDDANWNNKVKQTKEDYLGRYMSKNLYWLRCALKSDWDLETRKVVKDVEYINLYPGGFSTIQNQPKAVSKGTIEYAANNPEYFWQKPN
ncbi:transglutaminase domain-containing protein [Mucilaginibacter sp.]|uniref:TPR end-of-group domain-containing protein n=1 Tax=Mucilaginibacter sp. TaxID=1882438 RepID=UPI0025DECFD1|nr:transglutaminase domain-containing protein [Mucilaginibacter sp.]